MRSGGSWPASARSSCAVTPLSRSSADPSMGRHDGRDGVLPRLPDAGQGQRELTDHLEAGILLGRDHPKLGQHYAIDSTQRSEIAVGTLFDRDKGSPGGFGEEPDERISL